MQRAIEILNKEKSMNYTARKNHIDYIRAIGSPYIDKGYDEFITSLDDRVSNLENDMKDSKKTLSTIRNNQDLSVINY